MNEAREQLKPVERVPSEEPDNATWQTPAYEVVDTALEVTAYALGSR